MSQVILSVYSIWAIYTRVMGMVTNVQIDMSSFLRRDEDSSKWYANWIMVFVAIVQVAFLLWAAIFIGTTIAYLGAIISVFLIFFEDRDGLKRIHTCIDDKQATAGYEKNFRFYAFSIFSIFYDGYILGCLLYMMVH